MTNKLLRYALAAALAAAALVFLLPLSMGVCHVGMFWPVALLLLFIWMLLRPAQCRALLTGKRRVLWRGLLILLAAALVCVDVILGLMIRQTRNRPSGDTPVTVVVLGCQVRGLQPSPMLKTRIDSAYAYLAAHPDAVCVATGGMADSEIITEAQCIRDELVRRGIDPSRIYMEDTSENTRQNIANAAEIIRQNGLPTDIAVASDNFHQLRPALYAEDCGLRAQSLGCRSYGFLGPCYWAREVIAVAAAWALGR